MINAKVYLIKSDVETSCHCGHDIHTGEEYFMLRSNKPSWISLCKGCVELLGSPQKVDMKELVHKFFESVPPDGRGERRRESAHRATKTLQENRRKRKEEELTMKAEWI